MPNETNNNDEVDFTKFYDKKSEIYEQDLEMVKKQVVTKESNRKRTTVYILVGTVMILIIIELILLLIATGTKQEPKHSAPPGYEWVNPKNGIPHYERVKK